MDECESLDPEMAALQGFQSEPSEATSQDDEDELEELQQSLREVVQDQSVKPKVQCLMVDPSFSMVTVQSEDSGIVWETASSRCSTPWASETSSISEAYSMEGPGAAGKITVVFDEEKVVRRKTRSGGRSSRLGDRLSRPGSSRSASALGVERPEMAEVSIPNVKPEETETEPDLEAIKSKDQQLFSLISEGYEILNIRVPSKLPTVDEEESTELQDNLAYLDQTPKIRSRDHHDWKQQQVLLEEEEILEPQQDLCQMPEDAELGHTPQKDSHIDYFEKFTLLDHAVPGKEAAGLQEAAEQPPVTVQEEKQPDQESAKDSLPASEESFVIVTDVEIVGEHLDEVFYGDGASDDALQRREDEEEARMRMRRESQRSVKESGSALFDREETTLTPIYISSGPPKIIDPILLEEPTAMSFMYSDLYEDAVGERRRSDEEYSEAESLASEKSYKRRLSDSEEADGYLEKFILKDETPTMEVPPESVEEAVEGRMMWPQSKFDTTGCLIRAVEEEDVKKTEEAETQEASVKDGTGEVQPAKSGRKSDTDNEREETHLPIQTEGTEVPDISAQESNLGDDQTEKMSSEVKREQRDPPASGAGEKTGSVQYHSQQESSADCEQPSQAPEETVIKAPVNAEKSGITSETPEKTVSGEAAAGDEMAATDEKVATEAKAERDLVSEPEAEETLTSTDIETSSETFLCEEKEAAESVGPVEVIADCDSAMRAVVEITEKAVRETEIQTQVHIDLQEVAGAETTDVHEGGEEHEAMTVEKTDEHKSPESLTETDKEAEISGANKPEAPESVSTDSRKKRHEVHHQQEESDKTRLITEATEAPVPDAMKTGNDLILLVPKGQAVEMDVSIGQRADKTASVVVGLPEPVTAHGDAAAHGRAPVEDTEPAPALDIAPEVPGKEKEVGTSDLDQTSSAPASAVEADAEEQAAESYVEGDGDIFSPLRSFTPQEDLSGLHREAQSPDAGREQKDVGSDSDVQGRSWHVRQKLEEDEVPAEAPEVPVELEYEVIYKQDAKDASESEMHRDTEEPRTESGLDREERMEEEGEMGLSPDEELNEDEYEIIDAEEESEARLAAELLGMDWFCATCGCLLSQEDTLRVEHRGHEVTTVDNTYEQVKDKLTDWISELQGKSENIEDLVSELELAYNSVEDLCAESEAAMKAQNEQMMSLVMEQYNNMSMSMEEEKKAKLEQLYDQIVSFQEGIDSAKASLETASREADADARAPEDIYTRLKVALDSTMSLELGPKGLLVFEDYAKGNASRCHQRKGIPVPQRPTLQPQEPGSATSTSVTVYWRVSPDDIIDCFQVYCMEDPQGAVSEEYRVTVKESFCVLEELEPDKKYKVWVMAVNYTGCSLPSERLPFTTAPTVPVIDPERCTVLWDCATLRWNPPAAASHTYTLEYCRQYELEGEGLRSISGIGRCEQTVLLQPNENYLFYIKAVNEAGVSEQSEAALISTKGTRFHLLKATAHPALELSMDETTVHCSWDTDPNTPLADKRCPSILGELFPARGCYYWETTVSGSAAYRLGVAYSADRTSSLGEDRASWCLQRVPAPSGCRYQLLHNGVQSSVFVIDTPERVGTLLDYQRGRLAFYNAQTGQLLSSFSQRFARPCHPALALEMPGSLGVSMVLEVPQFAKDS